jgi:hypothetical protein
MKKSISGSGSLGRRKKLLPTELLAEQTLDKATLGSALEGGNECGHLSNLVREGVVNGLTGTDLGLTAPRLTLFHSGTMRTELEESTHNAHNAHDLIDVCAHRPHVLSMPEPTTKRPKGKNPTNLLLDAELVDIAKKFFPTTRYKNLSGFCESAIRKQFRAMAPKLRKAGFKLPEELFVK